MGGGGISLIIAFGEMAESVRSSPNSQGLLEHSVNSLISVKITHTGETALVSEVNSRSTNVSMLWCPFACEGLG